MKANGFVMLEAIVALTVLSGALLALYPLLGQAIDGTMRAAAHHRAAELAINAGEVMRTVNPMLRPNGVIEVGPWAVHWTSETAGPAYSAGAWNGSAGDWRIGLFDSRVRVVDSDGRERIRFSLRQVGYASSRPGGKR